MPTQCGVIAGLNPAPGWRRGAVICAPERTRRVTAIGDTCSQAQHLEVRLPRVGEAVSVERLEDVAADAVDRHAQERSDPVSKDVIEAPGRRIQFRIEGHETSSAISIFRCDFEAGARSPMPHSHDAFGETKYGLSGEVMFIVDGVRHSLGPGDVMYVPRGVVHALGVTEAASILSISAPGHFQPDYFR